MRTIKFEIFILVSYIKDFIYDSLNCISGEFAVIAKKKKIVIHNALVAQQAPT